MYHQIPKTAHITQFHVVQLFPDRIRAVCTLNEQVQVVSETLIWHL